MGEDFLRKRNSSFKRQRDECFKVQFASDLFTSCTPETSTDLCGTMVAGASMTATSEVWVSELPAHGPIRFFCGGAPVVDLDGDEADHLRREYGTSGAPIVGKITQVFADEGLAVIRVGDMGAPQ